jgi:hypothetical protein
LDKPLAVRLGKPSKKENPSNRAARVRKLLPYLKPDIVEKISKMKWKQLTRLTNTVEAINDNLITSTPDLIRSYRTMPEYQQLIRWAYSLGTISSDKVTKQWKKFSALLRWRALQSMTEVPERPQDFPGFGDQLGNWSEKLSPFWCTLCPWLEDVFARGVETKQEATRLLHLVTSRSFPAGDSKTREESLRKHAATLFSSFETTDVRRKILRRLSYLVGKTTRDRLPDNHRSAGHTSLTSSASIDNSVGSGGRAAEVGVKFRAWLNHIPDQSLDEVTWFGRRYQLIAGIPKWQTVCREDPEAYIASHRDFDQFLPENMELGESTENMNLDFENFHLEDPLYGIDQNTGYQLLQWSIEEGIRQGILVGSPYKSETDPLRLAGLSARTFPRTDEAEDEGVELPTAYPAIRASAIGEPGAKSRIVTVGEDWLTMMLQPFAHDVIGELRAHPSATAGLTRGWQMFEWIKGLRSADAPHFKVDRNFLSSDLTTATDFCTHVYSQAMLEGLLDGLGKGDSLYHNLCAQLLCSPRIYEGPVEEFIDRETSRGILMGDPGSKIVLTMHNLCAEYESILRFQLKRRLRREVVTDEEFLFYISRSRGVEPCKWRHFACSGDDHCGQGPVEYLSGITRNHELNGMSVSRPQNFISSRGAFYCEEMLLVVGLKKSEVWGNSTPLNQRPYERQPHIDAMKVRLFSPCAKEHEGKDEPNPAIGKARQMHGMLAWLGGGFEEAKPLFSARWEQRMKVFLPSEAPFRYLPVKLGGLECPAFHLSMTDMRQRLRAIPQEHLFAIKQVLDGEANPLLSRTLATFATNARARGVAADAIEDNIRETLSIADLVGGFDDSALQLASQTDDTTWAHLRFRDKQAIAKRFGLITVDDAVNLLDRPYLFRDMIAPEVSRRHGIDPYRSKDYEALPWAVRTERFYQNLFKNLPSDYRALSEAEEVQVIDKIANWAVTNEPLEIPRAVYFLPESVLVSDTLCTLRTPL